MVNEKVLISWLQDAYTMEKELVEILEAHRDQAGGYPDVQEKIAEHAKVTKQHEEKVEECIRQLGEEPSHTKGSWASFKGNMEAAATGIKDDRVIKNGIADYSTEYYEIALYTAIKTAAEELDHPDIAEMCDGIISEEQEMADWLEEHLPSVVTSYLLDMESGDDSASLTA